ncbi:hypothetical protein ABI59_14880 [Acidobacteria bacterium Mor1]|nr:hypothetical protein ABI59_14880 [Acidobacteria bacterium Mor1]
MAVIKCSVGLFGATLDISRVTREIEVIPTSTWRVGDTIGASGRRRSDSAWKFAIEKQGVTAVAPVLEALLEVLEPRFAAFLDVIRSQQAEVEFACVVYVDDDLVPALQIPNSALQRMAQCGADLDIDLYPNPFEPES